MEVGDDQARTAVSEDLSTIAPQDFEVDAVIGKVLLGKYEILELLGEGGMSRVYKARQLLTKKVVAFKMLHKHLSAKPTMMRRFQAEAQASHHLSHPHIITVYDFGITEDNQPCIVMDYLEGRNLSEIINNWGQMDVNRCIHIFIQALEALEHAHEGGVLHRDLKPSNIVMIPMGDDPDYVKLVDFGIAKILPKAGIDSLQLTQSGEVFGSPLYMSPEQCLGRMTDARSDIYSMGCLMYECLTGRPALAGDNMLETMHKQVSEMPASLGKLKADVRLVKRLEEIIFKSMEKEPQNRFQTARDLRLALEETRDQWQEGSTALASFKRVSSQAARMLRNRLGKRWKLILVGMFLWIAVTTHYAVWLYGMYKPGSAPKIAERNIPWIVSQENQNLAITQGRASKPIWDAAEIEGLIEVTEMAAKMSADPAIEFRQYLSVGTVKLNHNDYDVALKMFLKALELCPKIAQENALDAGYANVAAAFCLLKLAEERDNTAYIMRAETMAKRAIEIYELNAQDRPQLVAYWLSARAQEKLGGKSADEARATYELLNSKIGLTINNGTHWKRSETKRSQTAMRYDWEKCNLDALEAIVETIADYLYRHQDSFEYPNMAWFLSGMTSGREVVPGAPNQAGVTEFVLKKRRPAGRASITPGPKELWISQYRADAVSLYEMLRDLCGKKYGRQAISMPGTLAGYKVGCAERDVALALKDKAWKQLTKGNFKEAWSSFESSQSYFKKAESEFKKSSTLFEQFGSSDQYKTSALFNLSDVQLELFKFNEGLNTRSMASSIYRKESADKTEH